MRFYTGIWLAFPPVQTETNTPPDFGDKMLCISFKYQFTTVIATVWQLVKWSRDLPAFCGFSNYTGSPVAADCCSAAQNFKEKQCKDGASCNGEIRAALGRVGERLMKCSGGARFCPGRAAYLIEQATLFLTAVNLDECFWTSALPQWS